MKRFFGILMMVIAMMTVTTSVCAQAPNQKQRLSREQLAEKQAQYISRNLGLDEEGRNENGCSNRTGNQAAF